MEQPYMAYLAYGSREPLHRHPAENGRFYVRRFNEETGLYEWWSYFDGWKEHHSDYSPEDYSDDLPEVSYEDTWCEPKDGWECAP